MKCDRCSKRLGRPYAVESMGLEGAETPKLVGSRYRFVVVVECHGETMRCAMEVPRWWGNGMPFQALGHVFAFVGGAGAGVYRCEVRDVSPRKRVGSLITEVK